MFRVRETIILSSMRVVSPIKLRNSNDGAYSANTAASASLCGTACSSARKRLPDSDPCRTSPYGTGANLRYEAVTSAMSMAWSGMPTFLDAASGDDRSNSQQYSERASDIAGERKT